MVSLPPRQPKSPLATQCAFSKSRRDDMRSVNKVRNIFAHTLHPMTFAHDAIVTQCRKLSLIRRRPDMFPDPVNIDARKVYWNTRPRTLSPDDGRWRKREAKSAPSQIAVGGSAVLLNHGINE
jgi:hypothetical protein